MIYNLGFFSLLNTSKNGIIIEVVMADKDITINFWDKGSTDCYSTPPDHDAHWSKIWSPGYAFYPFASIPLLFASPQIMGFCLEFILRTMNSWWNKKTNFALSTTIVVLTDKGIQYLYTESTANITTGTVRYLYLYLYLLYLYSVRSLYSHRYILQYL